MDVRALFFTHAYPPMRYPRAIQISRLVKYLRCQVDVVCCNEIGAIVDSTLPDQFETNPGKILRYDHKAFSSPFLRKVVNFLAIPDAFLWWAFSAANAMLDLIHAGGYDVLVTFGQPMSNHLAGLYLKKKLGLPWIAHFSDPWADNPYHNKNLVRRCINKILEGFVIRAADRIVFTSEETRRLVMKKYAGSLLDKAWVLPHCFDPQLYSAHRRDDMILIRHLGNFYPPRSPAILIQALALLYQNTPELLDGVRVELIGEASSRLKVDQLVDGLPGMLLRFMPSVNYLESLRLMSEANLLLVIDAPFDTSVFLPSKLIDYLGSNIPIMAISPRGATSDLVSEYGCITASASDVTDVAEKLGNQLRAIRHGYTKTSFNEACRSRYHAARVAANFERMIADTLCDSKYD